MTHDDATIKDTLAKALQGAKPQKKAREMVFMPAARSKKRLVWASSVAAALILSVLASGLAVPTLARAIANVPLLGEAYARFIQGTGLDVAYQAGLVNKLNRSVTQGDFRLTIVAAYRDANLIVVAYQITSHYPRLLAELWGSSRAHALLPRFQMPGGGWAGGTGIMEYLTDEAVIYGINKIDPLSWSLFGQKLTMEVPGLGVTMTFPVQSAPGKLSQSVAVNEIIEYDGLRFRVDQVAFSPSATRVNYTILNSGKLPADVAMRDWNWSLRTDYGATYTFLSAGLTNSKNGHVLFMPTEARELSIILTGYRAHVVHENTLELLIGNSSMSSLGELTIGHIVSLPSRTVVHFIWAGEGRLGKAEIYLRDAIGTRVNASEGKQTDEGLILTFEHELLTAPLTLEIASIFIDVPVEIEAARVVRK